jgi:outer membrane protein TolC
MIKINMKFIKFLIATFFLTVAPVYPAQPVIVTDLYSFVKSAMQSDPRRHEQELAVDKAKLRKTSLYNSAILPKLEISGAFGPAPAYTIKTNAAGISTEDYDFGNIGPFAGFELKVLQPLNIPVFRKGVKAASCNVDITGLDLRKKDMELCRYLQEIYFKYLYARQMATLAMGMKANLDKTIHKADSLLDADDAGISQNDVFELKSYSYKADDAIYQSEYGLGAAKKAMAFSLDVDSVEVDDSLLYLRQEKVPECMELDTVLTSNHPDMKRLSLGIEAQKAMTDIAWNELFPDLFIVGSYKKTKSWNDRKNTMSDNTERLLDPYNKTSGSLGIGARFNVNVWSAKDNYTKEKLELDILESKTSYALKGLLIEMENQYRKVQMYYKKQASAESSMNAANSWLKSAAMKYDLDPSQAQALLKSYQRYIEVNRDYYECVMNYDIAVAELIAKIGLTLAEYNDKYGN